MTGDAPAPPRHWLLGSMLVGFASALMVFPLLCLLTCEPACEPEQIPITDAGVSAHSAFAIVGSKPVLHCECR
jgi:hypothetical protein